MANLKRYWHGWALDPFSDKPLKRQQQIFSSVLYTPLLFLLIGQGASEKATSPIVMSGMLGGSVTFPLNISGDTEIENVTWKCPSKFLAIAFPQKDALILDRDYNGRLNISSTYSMYISNLTKNDSGSYEAQINQKNSNLTRVEKFILHIYEKLKKPNVTQSTVHMKDGICRVQLTCSVEDGGNNVTYTWMPLPNEAVMPHGESSLTISWKHGESPPSLTCTAHNPVSNSSSQFSSGAVCSGPESTLKIWILLWLFCLCLLSALCWAIHHMQAEVSAEISELENSAGRMRFSELFRRYEELDMPAMSTRPDPSSDTSSDSGVTIEEDEEKTTMHSTVNRRNEVYDMVTEDTAHDLASESQAGYQVVTPDDTVVKSEVEEDIAHIQECLNVQGKTPVPLKKENSKHDLLLSTET